MEKQGGRLQTAGKARTVNLKGKILKTGYWGRRGKGVKRRRNPSTGDRGQGFHVGLSNF